MSASVWKKHWQQSVALLHTGSSMKAWEDEDMYLDVDGHGIYLSYSTWEDLYDMWREWLAAPYHPWFTDQTIIIRHTTRTRPDRNSTTYLTHYLSSHVRWFSRRSPGLHRDNRDEDSKIYISRTKKSPWICGECECSALIVLTIRDTDRLLAALYLVEAYSQRSVWTKNAQLPPMGLSNNRPMVMQITLEWNW